MKRTSRMILIPLIASSLALTGCGSSEPTNAQEASDVQKEAVEETADSTAELASAVESGILENFPGGISTTSPLFAITEYEDVSSKTVRVYVQENLDDAGRDEVSRHVFNMSGLGKDELSTVVVRDASGKDSNHYR